MGAAAVQPEKTTKSPEREHASPERGANAPALACPWHCRAGLRPVLLPNALPRPASRMICAASFRPRRRRWGVLAATYFYVHRHAGADRHSRHPWAAAGYQNLSQNLFQLRFRRHNHCREKKVANDFFFFVAIFITIHINRKVRTL